MIKRRWNLFVLHTGNENLHMPLSDLGQLLRNWKLMFSNAKQMPTKDIRGAMARPSSVQKIY